MRIAIFGATGSIGTQLVRQALEAGYEVNAFVRNPAKLPMRHSKLQVFKGDVLGNQEPLSRAIFGTDAVLVALGAGAKGKIRSEGTRNIVAAMRQAGVRHLICQSTLGAGESAVELDWKWWLLFRGPLRWAMADHQRQESIVRASGLDWTIVRPAAFIDGPLTGEYGHGASLPQEKPSLTVSCADVAHFLLKQLRDRRYASQAVSLSY